MPFPIRKILADQRDLLLFRPFKPAIKEYWYVYLAWGLFVTWLAGIGRYWDHPRAAYWQYLGLGSLVYVFILALFLWAIVAPLRPRQWSYIGVLIFVMLTSLPALIYAIPVEMFLPLPHAQIANMIFLAVVAVWRVALLMAFLKRGAGLNSSAAAIASLLPVAIIVTALAALNLEHVTFNIMGGNNASTQNDAAYIIVVMISALSVLVSPILLILYGVLVWRARRRPAESE